MHRYICALFACSLMASVAGMAGCATSSQNSDEKTVASKNQGSRVTCKREMVVGSHVPRTVCREQRVVEQERERDQDLMRRKQQQNIRIIPGAN